MDALKSLHYRKKLLELKTELEDGLKSNREDDAPVKLDGSIGRIARMEAIYAQQTSQELKQRKADQIQRIDRALKLIEQGKYGLCGKCKKPISDERLEFQPDAVMCIDCAG